MSSQYPAPPSQSVLTPIAFTMEATHEGPPPSLKPAWSEFAPLGTTQLSDRRLQLAVSCKTSAGLRSTLFDHSGPVQIPPGLLGSQICSIALGAVQIPLRRVLWGA